MHGTQRVEPRTHGSKTTMDSLPEFLDEHELLDDATNLLASGLNLCLTGAVGVGKSLLAAQLAQRLELELVVATGSMELADLRGRFHVLNDCTCFKPGVLNTAMRNEDGSLLFLDECDTISDDALNLLQMATDDRRQLFVPETGEMVLASPSFRIILAYNDTTNREILPSKLRSRFAFVDVPALSPSFERQLLLHRFPRVPKEQISLIIRYAEVTRKLLGKGSGATTRHVCATARAVAAGVDVLKACKYCLLNSLAGGNTALANKLKGAVLASCLDYEETLDLIPNADVASVDELPF